MPIELDARGLDGELPVNCDGVRFEDVIRFAPHLWHELRFYELLDVQASADE